MEKGSTTYRRGDYVVIYEDPMTRKKPEGRAQLVEHIATHGGTPVLQRWLVRFPNEHQTYQRIIRVD